MRTRFVAVLATVLVAALLQPAVALAWAPGKGATFNHPRGKYAAQYRIQRKVEKAVRHTPRGATIFISTYLLDRVQSVDALVAARKRGVHVRVVLDGGINTGRSRRLKRVLNADNGRGGRRWGPDQSFAMQCKGSCRGGGENQAMHIKFFAFSRTGSARHVIMVSSANLNKGGALKGYNDMFTMRGVESSFNVYRRIHEQMSRDKVDGNPYVVHREGRFESQFFPKRGANKGSDPTLNALNRVRCRSAGGGAGKGGHTVVHVAMFYWGGNRGMYLARKLLAMNRNGCRVNVIYGAPTREVSTLLRNSAWRGGINLWDSRVDNNGDGEVDLRVHTKYWTVNGSYAGDNSSWQVFTGSQNWRDQALTGGDENTLQISSRPAHGEYVKHWKFLRGKSRKIGR